MPKVGLKSMDGFFNRQMKDPEFRRRYAVERVKVALAQRVAEMRDAMHLSQRALSKRLGVSQQFISQLETGKGNNMTLDTLIRLAEALGCKVRISFPKHNGRGSVLEVM
jgi:DNA-binding Xre family transcriptional regulator